MKQQERTFDKEFIVKGTIGSGTFGTVKKCIWKKNNQLCAVKCIDNVNEMNIQKIQQQALIMENAQSDYSIQLYDHFFDEDNSQYVFIMPYCKFGSIEKKLNDQWTLDNLLLFMYQIAQAFVDFSEKEITHLDLKPENILLKGPGQYLVCDFGCSKVIKDLAISKNYLQLSYTKGLGTPQYAAPQLGQKNVANKYSDVWSLGVILYKAIYHKTPFKKNAFIELRANKTQFEGYKQQFQPVVSLVKGMISVQKRPSWRQIRSKIYDILKIDDSVQIVTSTGLYIEYINNLSILGTCLMHYLDRIKQELQVSGIDSNRMLRVMLWFLFKLTQNQVSSNNNTNDIFYFFPFTLSRMKNDQKLRIQQIHQQIFDVIIQRKLGNDQLDKMTLSQLKQLSVKQTKAFGESIMLMPQQLRAKIQKTVKYQFFKVKRMVEFISTQRGDNLSYSRKRQLSQLIKFLICS